MLCMNSPVWFVHSNMRQKLLIAYPYKYNTTNKNLFVFVEGYFHIISISKGNEKGSYTVHCYIDKTYDKNQCYNIFSHNFFIID